jgi:hypothetical protein
MFRPICGSSSGPFRVYFMPYAIGLQTLYGKGPHRLLRVGSRAAGGRIAISGVPYWLNYYVIFIVYVIYKCNRWPHNTGWRASGRRLVLCA